MTDTEGSGADRKAAVQFVQELQRAVSGYPESGEELNAALRQANDRLRKALRHEALRVTVQADGAASTDEAAVRTTCPSATVVAVEAPERAVKGLEAADVGRLEIFQTRAREDGVPETRTIGLARYADADGQWRVKFTSERFANRPSDSVVLHAELVGHNGVLLAAQALGPVV